MKTNKLFLLILVSLVLNGPGMFAQDTKNMTLLGNYGKGEGESKALFAAGSIVYYGLGNKIQIASLSNPASPVKVGSVIVSDVVEALVRTSINSNQYLVASGGTNMWIVDIKNPTIPVLVSSVVVAPGTVCEGIATSGTYAYVAAGGGGLRIYNISTPASPVFVSSIDSLAYCESVIISGQYAYVAAGSRSHIVDISNPASPVYVGQMPGYGGYHQYVNVRSGYAYICDYNAGLQVVNITNPANPVNVMNIPSGYRTADIMFDGNYAYVAVGDSGMQIYNVVNPASPVLTGHIKTIGRAAFLYYGAISISGNPTGHIYISDRYPVAGLSVINVSNPAAPVTAAFISAVSAPTGTSFTPFYVNGKAYVPYGTAGLRILDVSSPSSPTLLSTIALGGDSREVIVKDNYAYVASLDSCVQVINVTDAANPVYVKKIQTSRARGITLNGNYAYVATRDSGLVILNLTDASSPIWSNNVRGLDIENVAAAGNIIGLSFYSSMTFYDITDPVNPIAKGSTPSFSTGDEGFAIAGNYAYVPDGDTLKIFNLIDMMNPNMVSKFFTGGYGYICSVAGNYCYVASEATGVRAIDITNPAVPVEAGYYDGVPQSRGLVANGKYIYVAEKTDGVSIYSNDLISGISNGSGLLPQSISLQQNYPNPFNPSTIIALQLKEKAFVTLEVFNSIGERVAVLLNKQMPAGLSNISFDGSKLSTGVYLYRLQADNVTIAKKMLLLK
jgi:hypothetical protein